MPSRSSKRPRDANQLAKLIVDLATGEVVEEEAPSDPAKNPAAPAESEDAVTFMAKPDLANFAEALVNITSVRRRASLETETVGGPIDVAVISKDDGFVWVKRKHYFDADLNPRFFARKYGVSGQRMGGRHD